MNHSVMLAVLLLGLSVIVLCSCGIMNIVPANSTERCETEPCYTADQCAMEIMIFYNHFNYYSDLTLYFLQGEHFFSRGLIIRSVDNVKMMGSSSTKVRFQNRGLWVDTAQSLVIENLILIFSEIMPHSFYQLFINEIVDIKVENLTVVMGDSSLDMESDIKVTFNCSNIRLKWCVFPRTKFFNILTSNGVTIVECSFNSTTNFHRSDKLSDKENSSYLMIFDSVFASSKVQSLGIGNNSLVSVNKSSFINYIVSVHFTYNMNIFARFPLPSQQKSKRAQV